MQQSESIVQLAAALATAQGDFPTIPRDRRVKVRLRNRADGSPGGEYTFKYAPLETILEKTRKPLAANGLALTQAIVAEDNGAGGVIEVLRTTLLHSSGEWLACDVPIFVGTGDNKSQAYASGMTYSRRYGVTLILCVAADEDDDGNEGDQDGERPDFERQAPQSRERYQGSFPKSGGRSRAPDPQAPRAPQRRQPAAEAAQGEPEPDGVAELPPAGALCGEDLTAGQASMLRAAMLAAGIDEAEALRLTGGMVTRATFGEAHRVLKARVNEALDR